MTENPYRSTLNMFKTEFPIKLDLQKIDSEIQEKWNNEKTIEKLKEIRSDKIKYVLHDGPPYANGDIHLGHALNKILKDIVIKSRYMMGYNANCTPGWDCHGLPIEHKIMTSTPNLDKNSMIKECRNYASQWVKKQIESFKKLGIFMDFENPYLTMSPKYQANILRAFSKLVEKGFINRKNKTIPWCCGCQTTLASAEIEYKEKKDPSIYVLFEIEKNNFLNYENLYMLIWTTTPWTLPLNRAIMLKKNSTYLIAKYNEKVLIFGKNCIEFLKKITSFEFEILKEINSNELTKLKVKHLFEESRKVSIILDDSVEDKDGTACVHVAPGCGPIDYEIAIKNNIEIYSPITPDGKYSNKIIIKEIENMPVADGQIWVIKNLHERNLLFFKTTIRHSYPHCWRSHEPLIFRATPQWFFELNHTDFKNKALNEIKNIKFNPKGGQNFLEATVGSRWEWCLSRQRNWGVPIPALIEKNGNNFIINSKSIEKLSNFVEKDGIEFYDNITKEEFANKFFEEKIEIEKYEKETNILDVWFDSGVSHFAVLENTNEFPADLYLEGIDQHRGWFQSSLLTSVAINNRAPMKNIITHGFTVDEKGQKMSKSLGNVISPEEIIKKIGTDGLRLWVSSIGNDGDAIISEKVLQNIAEVQRKIINTCRFILQNITDFDFEKNAINDALKLHPFDQCALQKLNELFLNVLTYYQKIEFSKIFHEISDFCTTFLSTIYFDSLKDTLYCDKPNSFRRRSAQTSLFYILDSLTKMIAPILSHSAEYIFSFYNQKTKSIFLEKFEPLNFLCLFNSKSFLERISNFKLNDEMKKDIEKYSCKDVSCTINTEKYSCKEESYIKEALSTLEKKRIEVENKSIILNEEFIKIKNEAKLSIWEPAFILKDEMNKEIEKLRRNGTVKQSIETEVEIKIGKKWIKYANFLALKEFSNLSNYENFNFEKILEEVFLVSKLSILYSEDENLTLNISAKKHPGKKCERCWRYFLTIKDNICERCIEAIN
jgi:isoleucyl-tRNA synthetase